MDIQEIICDGMDWTDVAQDTVNRLAVLISFLVQ